MLKVLIGTLLLGGADVGRGFAAPLSPRCCCSQIDDGLMAHAEEVEESRVRHTTSIANQTFQLPCSQIDDGLMAHAEEVEESRVRHTTSIANQTFQLPRANDLDVIEQQVFHKVDDDQVFCVSSSPCLHGYPQSFGFHPTKGPKPVSGLFRLSCPLLVEAIDQWEGEGGVRQMTDWLRSDDRFHSASRKQDGFETANRIQKKVRKELARGDLSYLSKRLGEFNSERFLDSGIAGIPSSQTFNVKCIHAHVADHLCRRSRDLDSADIENADRGNIIGEHALRILGDRGTEIRGNEVCWQQCNCNRKRVDSDWSYRPKKNRQKLKTTSERRQLSK